MQTNFDALTIKLLISGVSEIVPQLKEEMFNDKYQKLYTLCLEFFEVNRALPTYQELNAVIDARAPVSAKGAYQAILSSIDSLDLPSNPMAIAKGLRDSANLRQVDDDIESLVNASRDRDIDKVQLLLSRLNNKVNLGGVEVTNMSDAKDAEDTHTIVPSFLDEESEKQFLGGGHSGLTIISAISGGGKALSNGTLIPTPNGFTKIEDLEAGCVVYGLDGNETSVIGVYPQGIRPTYKITFKDGRSILADAEHEWLIRSSQGVSTVTTDFLVQHPDTYSVPLCEATDKSKESLDKLISMFRGELVLDVKFIRSMGGMCTCDLTDTHFYKFSSLVKYMPDDVLCFFDLYINELHITSIEYIGETECTCISVEADDSLFVAGDYIVTHNTVALLKAARRNFEQGKNVLFITLELPKKVMYNRLMASLTRINFSKINSGTLDDTEKALMEDYHNKYFGAERENYFKIVDEPLDDIQLLNLIAVEAQLHKVDTVVIDYIQLVEMADSNDEWRGLSRLAKKLHKLTRTYGITILTASQVNVEGKVKGTIMPNITTRGSKELEFSSTQFIHIDIEPETGSLVMFTKKNRIAEPQHVLLEKEFQYMDIVCTGIPLQVQ